MSDSLHCLYCANAKTSASTGLRCTFFDNQLAYSLCARFEKAKGMDMQLKKLEREKLKYESNYKTARLKLIKGSILIAIALVLILVFTPRISETWVSTFSGYGHVLAILGSGGSFGYYFQMKRKFNYHNTRYQNAFDILTQYDTK